MQTDAGRVGPSRPLSPLWVTYAAGPRGRRSDRLRSAFHRLSPGSDGGLSPGSDGGRPQAWAGPTAPEAPLQLRPRGGLRPPPGPCGHQRASALTADPAGLLQRMPRVPDSDPHPQHRTQPGPGRQVGCVRATAHLRVGHQWGATHTPGSPAQKGVYSRHLLNGTAGGRGVRRAGAQGRLQRRFAVRGRLGSARSGQAAVQRGGAQGAAAAGSCSQRTARARGPPNPLGGSLAEDGPVARCRLGSGGDNEPVSHQGLWTLGDRAWGWGCSD